MAGSLVQAGSANCNLNTVHTNWNWISAPIQLPEYFHAPAGHSCEEAWGEVSCGVDGIAAVQTHGHCDGHDDQADAQRLHAFWSADIPSVGDGQDAQDERTGCNYLRDKSIRRLV